MWGKQEAARNKQKTKQYQGLIKGFENLKMHPGLKYPGPGDDYELSDHTFISRLIHVKDKENDLVMTFRIFDWNMMDQARACDPKRPYGNNNFTNCGRNLTESREEYCARRYRQLKKMVKVFKELNTDDAPFDAATLQELNQVFEPTQDQLLGQLQEIFNTELHALGLEVCRSPESPTQQPVVILYNTQTLRIKKGDGHGVFANDRKIYRGYAQTFTKMELQGKISEVVVVSLHADFAKDHVANIFHYQLMRQARDQMCFIGADLNQVAFGQVANLAAGVSAPDEKAHKDVFLNFDLDKKRISNIAFYVPPGASAASGFPIGVHSPENPKRKTYDGIACNGRRGTYVELRETHTEYFKVLDPNSNHEIDLESIPPQRRTQQYHFQAVALQPSKHVRMSYINLPWFKGWHAEQALKYAENLFEALQQIHAEQDPLLQHFKIMVDSLRYISQLPMKAGAGYQSRSNIRGEHGVQHLLPIQQEQGAASSAAAPLSYAGSAYVSSSSSSSSASTSFFAMNPSYGNGSGAASSHSNPDLSEDYKTNLTQIYNDITVTYASLWKTYWGGTKATKQDGSEITLPKGAAMIVDHLAPLLKKSSITPDEYKKALVFIHTRCSGKSEGSYGCFYLNYRYKATVRGYETILQDCNTFLDKLDPKKRAAPHPHSR